jgi:hypothetical protein
MIDELAERGISHDRWLFHAMAGYLPQTSEATAFSSMLLVVDGVGGHQGR